MRTDGNKPCPFCGYDKQDIRECAGYFLVACRNCGATGQMQASEKQAVDSWNERSAGCGTSRKDMRDAFNVGYMWPSDFRVASARLQNDK